MKNDELKAILTEIHESVGLTPEHVVDAARDAQHPLHHRFEWSDVEAGRSYRLEQARDLIRTVKIRYAESDTEVKEVRAFVASRTGADPHKPVYRPTDEVMADPFARQLLLQEARREALTFQRKYAHLEEYAEIVIGIARAV